MRARARSANSGVPAKTRRRKAFRSGGLAQLLGELRADALLLQLREVLDEHLALQVIHLVLDAHSEQSLGFQRERIAVLIVRADFDALGALNELVDSGHRQAAFLDVGHPGRLDDLGVDQNHQRVAALGNIDHDDALGHIDLDCRKPDSRRGVHGFGHVGDELLEALVEYRDRGRDPVESGVGIAKDIQAGHRAQEFTCKLKGLYGQSQAACKQIDLVLNWAGRTEFQAGQESRKGRVAMFHQVRKSIIALAFFFPGTLLGQAPGAPSSAPGSASASAPLAIKPDAPDRYVVVPGDTLWGISQRYTDSPWRWPELWNMNKEQIRNPHLIYPGYVIILDRERARLSIAAGAEGTQPTPDALGAPPSTTTAPATTAPAAPGGAVKLGPRVRAESLARQEIPSIPPSVIEPFLSRPLVIEPDGFDKAPTIISAEMARLQADLEAETDVRLVSITVGPAEDSPEVLAEYAARFGADRDRWLFLTGQKRAIYTLAQ